MMNPKERSQVEIHHVAELEKLHGFEKAEIAVQKVFWVLVALFLLAGLTGLWGGGALSNVSKESSLYRVEYERFVRQETPNEVSVFLRESPDTVRIMVNTAFVDRCRIEQVVPQPVSVSTEGGRLIYTFKGAARGLIRFVLSPGNMGVLNMELTILGQEETVSQYVYF